jgi:hypothetical protein
MKRVRIVGLCLVAAGMTSALSVADAGAMFAVKLQHCLNVAASGYSGASKYADADCLRERIFPPGTFEFDYPGLPDAFSGTFTAPLELRTATQTAVSCTGGSYGSGAELSGENGLAAVVLKFTGCKRPTFGPCTTIGHPEEIESNPLAGLLGVESEGQKTAAVHLFPVHRAADFMDFTCSNGHVPASVRVTRASAP